MSGGMDKDCDNCANKHVNPLDDPCGTCIGWNHFVFREESGTNKPITFVDKLKEALPKEGNVSHPKHYTSHPSGIECIQITEHMGFNLGCAMKYIWRCDLKRDAIEDLRKAVWYIEREINKRMGESNE